MEFYQGLRERNWTSPWYKEDAQPWRVQFFTDSGRFMAPAYPGYRCAGGSSNICTITATFLDSNRRYYVSLYTA